MKTTKLATVIAITFFTNAGVHVDACTAVAVGKAASHNNSFFIARNEDFNNNNWAKHLVYRAAKTTDGGEWNLGDNLVVPMPKQLYAYSAMPDWDANTVNDEGKYFEERGVNEFNVAISATNSAEINEKAMKADPLTKEGGITEALIPSLILPQVKTAREGVELLGKYLKKYGAGEGNILYLADATEIWMLEIGSGHHWIAVKVPDNAYAVVANSLRIHDVDLTSPDILHSQGLFEFVKTHSLLKNPDAKSFNFAKAFGVMGDEYNVGRIWRGQQILSPSVKQEPNQTQYPLFLTPDEPIDVAKIKRVLTADYKDTVIEKTAKRPMRVETQLESHIIEIRPKAPKLLQPIIWQSFGVLSESLLVPIYNTVTTYPSAYTIGTDMYDSRSAYWQFRGLTALANTAPAKYYPLIHKTIEFKQKQVNARFNQIDQALRLDKASDVKTQSAEFSIAELNKALEVAKQLQTQIMTDLTKVTEKKYTDKEKSNVMALPN